MHTYGAGAVDTGRPTPAGQNFSAAVQYYVEDAAGNAAPQAQRLIRVVCPAGESYCTDQDGLPWCTSRGICGGSAAPATSSSPGTSSSSSSTSAAAAAASFHPAIALNGPAYVEVPQLGLYDRCAASAAVGAPCDRGAAARDDQDGNLDRFVQVCGVPFRTQAGQRPVPLLLACNISTDTPGTYTLDFTVTNSARRSANVSLTLRVVSICPAGEVLCSDRVSCSVDMVCLAALPQQRASDAGSISSQASQTGSSPGGAAAASAPGGPTRAAANQPPSISLVTADGLGPVVYIRRGSSYRPCSGASPTAAAPCEPGAVAFDPDAADGRGNLTDSVVVCPPAECFTRGCSPAELQRHRLAVKGLAGCPLDPMAAEGTAFQVRCWLGMVCVAALLLYLPITTTCLHMRTPAQPWPIPAPQVDFWVWDSGSPARSASVNRTVSITDPCPDPQAPHFCQLADGQPYSCTGVPCDQLARFLRAAPAAPNLTLLPSSETVFLEHRQPAPFYLGPCSGAEAAARGLCGAVASAVGTGGSALDLTSSVSVADVSSCSSGSSAGGAQPCFACDAETLTLGRCPPGSYVLQYAVTGPGGASSAANRTVVVYQRGAVNATLVVLTSDNGTVAAGLAGELRNISSAAYGAAVRGIQAKLAPSGVDVGDADVDFSSARVGRPACRGLVGCPRARARPQPVPCSACHW